MSSAQLGQLFPKCLQGASYEGMEVRGMKACEILSWKERKEKGRGRGGKEKEVSILSHAHPKESMI